jgi:hypothetical protein
MERMSLGVQLVVGERPEVLALGVLGHRVS